MRLTLHGQWIFVVSALGLRLASSPTANISYLMLAGYAMLGRAQAVQALFLSFFFTMINPGVAPEASWAGLARYIILISAMLSVWLRHFRGGRGNTFRIDRLIFVTILLGVGISIHSILFSPIRDVSLLKSISWTIAFSTLFSAWTGLSKEDQYRIERQIFFGLILIMLASTPLLLSDLGYLRNGRGFQGLLNHPQAFGIVMAPLTAWLASQLLFKTHSKWYLVIFFCLGIFFVFLSEARTAGLSLALGMCMSLITGRWLAQRPWRDFLPGLRSKGVQTGLALALLGTIAAIPQFSPYIGDYFMKNTDNTSLVDLYEGSRGSKITEMWKNIEGNIWRGIGFGIASNPYEMEVARDPVLGLPTGAAVEKGVMLLAVWEELGLIGLVSVLAWLWLVVRRAAVRGGFPALSVCLTILFINFGEAVLFSPGGVGMLLLILIAWAASGKPG